MATTTVKTWSENPGDVTAEGLIIGGIQITYAELAEIQDRETALDIGVTPDLLDMWDNLGGRDFTQLVDWLYQYAHENMSDEDKALVVGRICELMDADETSQPRAEVTIGSYRTHYDKTTRRFQVLHATNHEILGSFHTQAEATAEASRLDDLTNPEYR
jgi:hypothetical protein